MTMSRCLRPAVRTIVLAAMAIAAWSIADRAHADDLLYRAFGERDGFVKIVDDATDRWLADDRIKDTFDNLNIPRFKDRLVDQLCELTGGPCHYKGRNMYLSHKGLHLDTIQFNALVEGLQLAMEKYQIPFRTQNKLLVFLAPMERDIVTQ